MLTEKSENFRKPKWLEKVNPGKDYNEYMREEERKNAAKRKKRMDAAREAKALRKKKGIDITEKGLRPMAKWSI